VIGREFSHELIAAVADRPQEQLEIGLDQLVASELVFRRGAPPDAAYSFKHNLVKDVAYQSLLKSRRQQLHARLAQVFEERFPGVVETQPELLAYHLTEAGLDAPAADAWARAGRAALGRSAMREAANSLSRAVGLLRGMPSSPDRQRFELELLGGLGVALTNTLGPASSEAQAAHERAAQLSDALGDRKARFRARWNLWRVYNVRAEYNSAVAAGDALTGGPGRGRRRSRDAGAPCAVVFVYFPRRSGGDLSPRGPRARTLRGRPPWNAGADLWRPRRQRVRSRQRQRCSVSSRLSGPGAGPQR
jgi:hypothetical protein